MPDMITLRPFEQERFKSLMELAQLRFDNLTRPEANVLMHSAAAYVLPEPPADFPRPPVRSEFLRWLLIDPDAKSFIDPKGIRIWSVSIQDPLDLQGCSIPHYLHFLHATIDAELILAAAEVKGLFIFEGMLKRGLPADGLTVNGPLFILRTKCDGMIRLIGAEINGNIDLSGTELTGSEIAIGLDGARIRGSVFMHNGFRSTGEIRMLNAHVGGDLAFNGATLTATGRALSLDKICVEGVVYFGKGTSTDGSKNDFRSAGSVNLLGSQIRGDLNFDNADLAGTGISLNLATAQIKGHVYLHNGFRAAGQINMHSVEIGNSFDLSGATLTQAGTAVSLQQATVRGTIVLSEGFTSSGIIDLQGAQIGGNLVCDDCKLPVLYCANMTLKGDLQWTGIRDAGSTTLCLNGATIKSLRDDRESWPSLGGLRLDGLIYQELTLHSARTEINRQRNELGPEHSLDLKIRVDWLLLQSLTDRTEPQPWMQLSALLRAKGDDDAAKHIIFELRRAQAQSGNMIMRAWKIAFAKLQQQPLWVLLPIVLITSFATCLFWFASAQGAMAPTSKEPYIAWSAGSRMDAAYPRFNPFIYSLENDLPLVKFGVDDKWAPDPTYKPKHWAISYSVLRWARVFFILCGWFQATLLATAIGSRFKS